MKSKSDPRHNARRLALSSIFSWLFADSDNDACLELSQDILELPAYELELAKKIIEGVQTHRKEIDDAIRRHAPEWPIDKIAKVDLVILRIAVYEVLHNKDVPAKVAIDEAVELAKEFGNDNSSKFINGVLGSIVDDSEKEKE